LAMKLTRDNLRIALVDDDLNDRELLWNALLTVGFMQPMIHFDNVSSAFDYVQCLDATGGMKPHIILLDVNMPIIDGVHALRGLGRAPAFRQVSVIVLTGADAPETRREMAQLGIFRFLVKQFDNANVIAALDDYIALYNREVAPTATGG